jgi:hypothetical protein
MFGRERMILTIVACMSVMPATAQAPAPTTTAFDGTYVGVSRELSTELMQRGYARQLVCEPPGVPDSLTITNGLIRSLGGSSFEGTVTPQGSVTMRTPRASNLVSGQIDAQGTMTGKLTGNGGCVNTFVWRKQSR